MYENKGSFDTTWSLERLQQHSETETRRERLENFLFLGMASLFTPEVPRMSLYANKLAFLVAELFLAFQIVTLFSTGKALADWDAYGWPWSLLYYSRVDYVAYKLGVLPIFLWCAPSAVIVLSVLFLLHCSLRARDWSVPLYLSVTQVTFELQCKFLFNCVALQCATVVNLALSSTAAGTIQDVEPEAYEISTGLALLSGVAFVLLFILKYVFIYGSTEIAHHRASVQFCTKAHSTLDQALHLCQVVTILYCAFKGHTYPQYTSGIVAVSYSGLCLKQIQWQPMYNDFVNQAFVIVYSATAAVAIAFVVGHASGQALVVLLLAVCMTPCIVYFALQQHYKAKRRLMSLPLEAASQFRDAVDFEVALRQYILKKEEGTLQQFTSFYQNCRSRMPTKSTVAWEVFFLMHSLRQIPLASVKWMRHKACKYSIEGSYHIFRCKRELEVYKAAGFDESQFVKHILDLGKVRQLDKNLSLAILKFLELVQTPDVEKLQRVCKYISSQVQRVDSTYQNMHKTYGPTEELVLLMSTYYSCVRTDETKAAALTQSFEIISNNLLANQGGMSALDVHNCLMIVSADDESLGIITYANTNTVGLLDSSIETVVGSSFIKLVPRILRHGHKQFLKRFFLSSSTAFHQFPESLTIENSHGHLVEVYVSLQIVSDEGKGFYLVMMKEVEYCHAVLFDQSWRVYAVTSGLAAVLGAVEIRGTHLSEVFKLDASQLTDGPLPVSLQGVPFYLVYWPKTLKATTVHLVYLLPTLRDALELTSRPRKVQRTPGKRARELIILDNIEEDTEPPQNAIRSLERSVSMSKSIGTSFVKSMSETRATQLFVEQTARSLRQFRASITSTIGVSISFSVILALYLYFFVEIDSVFHAANVIHTLVTTLGKMTNQVREGQSDQLGSALQILSDFMHGEDHYIREIGMCNFFEVFSNTEIPVWEPEGSSFRLTHMSFYQFLDLLITHVQDLSGDNAFKSREFILANGFGAPYAHARTAIHHLHSCQHTEVQDADLSLVVVIGVYVVLVVVTAFWIGWAICGIRRSTANNWRRLLSQFSKHSAQFERGIRERLRMLFDYEEKPHSKSPNADHTLDLRYFPFLWRPLLWKLLLGLFVYVQYFVIHQPLDYYLKTRHDLFTRTAINNANRYELEYWLKEEYYAGTKQSVQSLFNEVNPYPPSNIALAQVLETLKQEQLYLSQELKEFMDDREFTYFFKSCIASPKTGCYAVAVLLEKEANSVLHHKGIDEFFQVLEHLALLSEEEGEFLSNVMTTSTTTASDILSWVFLVTAVYMTLAVLYTAIIVVPFMKQQSDMLRHRHTLVGLLPSMGYRSDSS